MLEKIKIAKQTAIEFSKAADRMELQYRVGPMLDKDRQKIIKEFYVALHNHAIAFGELLEWFYKGQRKGGEDE